MIYTDSCILKDGCITTYGLVNKDSNIRLDKNGVFSGTITGLRISSVDEKAFLDACAALVPYADGESDAYIYDSAGAFLKATLKAQGTGETLGEDALSGWDLTSGWNTSKVTINDADTFTLTSIAGFPYRGSLLTVGGLYKSTYQAAGDYSYTQLQDGVGTIMALSSGVVKYATPQNTSVRVLSGGSIGNVTNVTSMATQQVLTPSTSGVTLQASKWDTTESFGVKATGFKYNEASYAVRVYKAR